MTGPCFVGAEVFVYARDPRDAAKQSRALHWIAHLWQERLGRTSVQVLSEYYVFATRTLKPHVAPGAAWDDVRELMAWRPLPVDETLLRRAREIEQRWDLSWRDSMAVGGARLADCGPVRPCVPAPRFLDYPLLSITCASGAWASSYSFLPICQTPKRKITTRRARTSLRRIPLFALGGCTDSDGGTGTQGMALSTPIGIRSDSLLLKVCVAIPHSLQLTPQEACPGP